MHQIENINVEFSPSTNTVNKMTSDDENLQLIESKKSDSSDKMGKVKTTDAGLKNVRALLFLFLWYFFSGYFFFTKINYFVYNDLQVLYRVQTLADCCCL